MIVSPRLILLAVSILSLCLWSELVHAQSSLVAKPTKRAVPMAFSEMLIQWAARNPDEYESHESYQKAAYGTNGYYIDPIKARAANTAVTTSPISAIRRPFTPSICYDPYYSPYNGYSQYGYDAFGYDPFGYDEGGYDKYGYSRVGRETQSQFNLAGLFENPQLAALHAEFIGDGSVRLGPRNEVLRYDDRGYDQYGNSIYGDPRPPICAGEVLPPIRPAALISHIPITIIGALLCKSQSEVVAVPVTKRLFRRKPTTAMTTADWSRFRAAWNYLNDNGGIISIFATTHVGAFNQHNSNKFLPWHREFVARIEDELHRIDSCVWLPYWDVVTSPAFPAGISTATFPPPVKTFAANGVTLLSTSVVTRSIGSSGPLPNAATQTWVNSATNFATFSSRLEQFHNAVHVHVGGNMLSIGGAPMDPVFYMHHANVDRLWALWQATHPLEPSASVVTSTINPLQFGGADTRTYASQHNIATVATVRGVGYTYI